VTVGPSNPLKVKVDETARFECLVDAKPSVSSVKWTRRKRFIETNFKHTIPKVRLEDAGSYICTADNGLGETGKKELTLDVLYPPVVTIPEEKIVHEGDSVTIECQVASNPKATSVQWLKEGDSSFHQPGPTLKIHSVTAKDNGKYICSASNFIEPTGEAKVMHKGNATMNIHVHHKPGKAYIIPSSRVAIDGKRISLTCGANPPGYPEPEYKWWKEGSEATLTTGKKFTINPARLSNVGLYHCRATNQFGGSKIADFDLKVYQAPRILSPLPASIKKSEGDMGYSLSCSATGKPRPVVTWFKNGKVINLAKSNEYQISVAEKDTLTNGASTVRSTLLFKGPERLGTNKLMPTDRGHYTCQFHNDVKSTDSSMLLKIEHAPIFLHKHNKVAYDVGETAYIACRMQAFPKPQLSWSFRNNVIRNDRFIHEKNFTQMREDIYQGVLKIYKVQQSSYGDYKCKGRNKLGDKTTLIKLQPKGKPERPLNLNVKEAGYNYITIGFERGFDGGYKDTKFTVQYQQQHFKHPLYEDCGPLSICNITRLEQNTVYSLRVKASNERGESKYSDEILMSTRIDINKIPLPENVHFERSTSVASFNLARTTLRLIAKIELENNDGTWNQYQAISIKETPFSEIIRNNVSVKNLRVRFCLETNEELCGLYTEALVVDKKPNALKAAFKEPWVIGLIVVIILLALVAMLILIKCCFYKNVKTIKTNTLPTTNGNPKIVHSTTIAPPPYTSLGIENKGVDTLKDASSDNLKTNIYSSQNGYTTYHSNGQVTYPDPPNSNTNSANGGSVNSQDSLWNVKNNGNSDVFNQQQIQSQQIQQQQHPMSTYGQNGHLHYDTQPQPMQTHVVTNGFVGSEDYTHYPYPDEYLNDRNCQYLIGQNADPYASSVSKPQSHNGIDPECKYFL
jgi:echinoid protein